MDGIKVTLLHQYQHWNERDSNPILLYPQPISKCRLSCSQLAARPHLQLCWESESLGPSTTGRTLLCSITVARAMSLHIKTSTLVPAKLRQFTSVPIPHQRENRTDDCSSISNCTTAKKIPPGKTTMPTDCTCSPHTATRTLTLTIEFTFLLLQITQHSMD